MVVISDMNRLDLLDPSLLQPGRFNWLVYLGPVQKRGTGWGSSGRRCGGFGSRGVDLEGMAEWVINAVLDELTCRCHS